jgi:DNA-binding transcriptional LysR family regulator
LPDQPDNVVQPFFTQTLRLVASKEYVDTYGPLNDETLERHRFIGPHEDTPRAPYYRWLMETVPERSIVFRASDMNAVKEAVIAGIGIGFIAAWDRNRTGDLVDMLPSLEEWSAKIWLVTHMDLHRTAKVQSFVRHLKQEVKTWPVDQ